HYSVNHLNLHLFPTRRSSDLQFVLLPDYEKKEFVFSTRNKTKQNENTDFIIQYMNKNFERYANAGTTGEDIEIDQKIFNSWIVKDRKSTRLNSSHVSISYAVF